jgi:hypothetical protein
MNLLQIYLICTSTSLCFTSHAPEEISSFPPITAHDASNGNISGCPRSERGAVRQYQTPRDRQTQL